LFGDVASYLGLNKHSIGQQGVNEQGEFRSYN
jgi:hypothetical protein